MSDQQPSQGAPEREHESEQVSTGPSSLAGGPEQLGGADAVPDTPDKNFPEDSRAPGRGSSSYPDEDPS